MIKRALTILLAFIGLTAQAKITLPALFGNNMVLQQQADAAIWGTANKNATVPLLLPGTKRSIPFARMRKAIGKHRYVRLRPADLMTLPSVMANY